MSDIALVQMVSSFDVDRSLMRCEALLAEAARSDPRVVFLPENFASLGHPSPSAVGAGEVTADGLIRSFLREMALRHRFWLVAGTLPCAVRGDGTHTGERVRAACFVLDEDGREVGRYDKIHMFDADVDDVQQVYRESATFEPGDQIVDIESPVGRIGLSVCYDLRFPEIYLRLAAAGAELLSVPSAFTRGTGAAHFEPLLRARAIEHLAFVVAACQGGSHDSGRETWGESAVIGPWGEVIARCGTGEDVVHADIDLDHQRALRKQIPVHAQRRL